MSSKELNNIQEESPKPKSSGKKLYVFIFLIYLVAMILLFTSC